MTDEKTPNPALACDPNGVCSTIDAARVEKDKPFKNSVVAYRKLRIQVLDVRSLQPVPDEPVEGIWLGDAGGGSMTEIVRYLATDREWDISKHRPLAKTGTKWKQYAPMGTAYDRSLVYASQLALNALGFDAGTPGDSYGRQGKTAYLNYRLAQRDVEMKPADLKKTKILEVDKLDEKFIKLDAKKSTLGDMTDTAGKPIAFDAPDDASCEKIVKHYNTRCYRAAQFHLAALGFYPDGSDPLADFAFDEKDGGDWSADWIDAYQRYKKRYSVKGNVDWVHTAAIGKELRERPKPFVTNKDGELTVPIPLVRIRDGFSIQVRCKDFPLVPEATLAELDAKKNDVVHREIAPKAYEDGLPLTPMPLMLSPRIRWTGPQSTAHLGKFGWWLEHKARATSERRREFQRSVEFRFPALTGDAAEKPTWKAVQEQHRALSGFYVAGRTPELVVLAMRWCAPLWDEFDDPDMPAAATSPTVTNDVYCWPGSREVGQHMHLVTHSYDMGGYDPFGGKGYGLFEHQSSPANLRWRGGDGHHGLDVHSQMNDEQFAVHGGTLTYNPNSVGFGHRARVSWQGAMSIGVDYGHITDKVGTVPRHVCAGEIIAKTGREGNIGANSRNPTHLHIQIGGAKSTNVLRSLPDAANQPCIPENGRTPLLFPCRCHTTLLAAELANCAFADTAIASTCWAVAELACPHMPRAVKAAQLEGTDAAATLARRRVQAQLRKLGHYSAVAAKTTLSAAQRKALDGDFGDYADAGFGTAKIDPDANVRSSAEVPKGKGKSLANRIWQAPKGTRMGLLETSGSWYRVELPPAAHKEAGQSNGWMYKSTVDVGTLGSTRDAIFRFKQAEGLLGKSPTNVEKYTIDEATLERLEKRAGVIPLSEPAT